MSPQCASDPELFFPEKGGSAQVQKAKAICAECPMRLQCLELALSFPEEETLGVWGGTTFDERRRLRRVNKSRQAA